MKSVLCTDTTTQKKKKKKLWIYISKTLKTAMSFLGNYMHVYKFTMILLGLLLYLALVVYKA